MSGSGPQSYQITKSFSVYLDFVRFGAAFIVLLGHMHDFFVGSLAVPWWGHEAVIVFFVLSGYVIAYVADTKESTLRDYTVSRLARVYSVVLPAIVLTGLFDWIGSSFDPTTYVGIAAWDYAPVRVMASLTFLNQIWFVYIQLFSNVPYWSLSYEVFYYVGFAFLTYMGGRKGWLLFLGVGLLAGPKILVLMPLWWIGVFLYRSKALLKVPYALGWLLLPISLIGVGAFLHLPTQAWSKEALVFLIGPELVHEFAFSKWVLADYVLAVFVAMHFVSLRAICARHTTVSPLVAQPIRAMAASTFTLYLLHKPMLHFFPAVLGLETVTLGDFLILMALVLTTVYGVSLVTEQKKHVFKRGFVALFDFIEDNMTRLFGTHRGLVRLIIANALWLLGPYRRHRKIDPGRVKRLVFVCQGNICRSPFGHHLAQMRIDHLPVCSMGLGTTTGMPADETANEVARNFGVDLSGHKTTAFADFKIEPGDLYLVMEDRHLRQLKPLIAGQDVQVALLGLWCPRPLALLYDPHRMTRDYFKTCFGRIALAVTALQQDLERAPEQRRAAQ